MVHSEIRSCVGSVEFFDLLTFKSVKHFRSPPFGQVCECNAARRFNPIKKQQGCPLVDCSFCHVVLLLLHRPSPLESGCDGSVNYFDGENNELPSTETKNFGGGFVDRRRAGGLISGHPRAAGADMYSLRKQLSPLDLQAGQVWEGLTFLE